MKVAPLPAAARWSAREAGQVLPLVALLVVLAAVTILLLGRLGAVAGEAAQARLAADAAALAGAVEGEAGARALAAANGGELVRFEVTTAGVVVEVRVGGSRATAAATVAPLTGGRQAQPRRRRAATVRGRTIHPAGEKGARLVHSPCPGEACPRPDRASHRNRPRLGRSHAHLRQPA
jgi:hypothetical protein